MGTEEMTDFMSLQGLLSDEEKLVRQTARRHHVDETGLQKAVKAAARAAGLTKRVSCHVLPRSGAVQHPPFEKNDCLSCHDPHGGSTLALQIEENPDKGCLHCHAAPTEVTFEFNDLA